MELKVGQLIESMEMLMFLMHQPIPVRYSAKLMVVNQTISNIYSKHIATQNSLIDKFGKVDGDNIVLDDNMEEFQKAMQLAEEELITIDLPVIPISVLESVMMSAVDLNKLSFMVDFDN